MPDMPKMPEERQPWKGYSALRRGRWSEHNADYFLTICIRRPQADLHSSSLVDAIFGGMHRLAVDGLWTVHTAVIMPDHLHLLVTLGERSDLSECVRMFKGRLVPALRKANLAWQPSFYDHRLRSAEDLLPVFLYIYLNPYREKLINPGLVQWPGYYCASEDWAWFGQLTDGEQPFPAWLR
ncbi:MAG: transposase [Opitutaceae bacterium]|nr:transposase [Opitutaceae bacterium]